MKQMKRAVIFFLVFFFIIGTGSLRADTYKKNLEVEGRTFSFYDQGQGPSVILIHGLFANKEQWNTVREALADRYRVVVPDLPGYGESPLHGYPDYVLEKQVKLLNLFLEKLNISECYLVGNSMGGAIVALYAERYPQQVLSVSFVGAPAGVTAFSEPFNHTIYKNKNPMIPLTEEDFQYEMTLLFANPPKIPRDIMNTLIHDYQTRHAHYESVFLIALTNMLDIQSQHKIGALKKPTLILWGEKDQIFPVSSAKILNQAIPASRLQILKNTGHLPMIESPTEVVNNLVDFFAEIP